MYREKCSLSSLCRGECFGECGVNDKDGGGVLLAILSAKSPCLFSIFGAGV